MTDPVKVGPWGLAHTRMISPGALPPCVPAHVPDRSEEGARWRAFGAARLIPHQPLLIGDQEALVGSDRWKTILARMVPGEALDRAATPPCRTLRSPAPASPLR